MSNPIQQLRDANNPNLIKVPFDAERTPRAQIEEAVTSLPPRRCERHPYESLPVDKTATLRNALRRDYPHDDQTHRVEFSATYERCTECLRNEIEDEIEVERCAVGPVRFGRRDICVRDEKGKPLPRKFGSEPLEAGRSAREQFGAWLAKADEIRCPFNNQLLPRRDARMTPPFESWAIEPQFSPCLRCSLERLGIAPDDSHASFDNLVIDPPALQQLTETCRAFAAAPKGVLMLLGNVGTGKTHLAIAILRERLRRGAYRPVFVKHRHFLAKHWLALRPVAFREEPPESPLARCQESSFLVYDELTAALDISRAYEDVLLDLFEQRIGHFRPSVITSNVSRDELEPALGSRLHDRLSRANFAVLEFGFESKRKSLNADYLNRNRPGGHA